MLLDVLKDVASSSALFNSADTPFTAHVRDGLPRVAIVAGDNCTGKSLFVEVVRGWACHHNMANDTICVSIRERTGSGLSEMAHMRRAFMFGDETEQSTGAISAKTVQTAFSTLESRCEEGKHSILVLDEPELGMSEAYAGALGEMMGQRLAGLKEPAVGVIVVTHSKALVARMGQALGAEPTFVHIGQPRTLQEWLKTPVHKTVEDLLALDELNLAGRQAVWQLLK